MWKEENYSLTQNTGAAPRTGYIAVVGGVNMDIRGTPENRMIPGDSNPGYVRLSLGGVGRNIAHNLRLLGQTVSLISVFGSDGAAAGLRKSCTDLGIDISASLTVAGAASSAYVFLTDETGEMLAAVSDMDICDYLTPEAMESRMDVINGADLCVIDTNIPAATLEYISEHACVPLFADPVSTTKMRRLDHMLGRIHTFKPNCLEAEQLTGIHISDEESARKAADLLLNTGMKRVFLSLGEHGMFCADDTGRVMLPGICAKTRDTTGGGDCAMAALAYAWRAGLSLENSGRLALAAGSVCVEGENTVNDRLTMRGIYERAGISYPEDV